MIKLIIFDLDGTLIDSLEDITVALNHAVAPLNIPPKSVAEMRDLVGSGISFVIERVLGDALSDEKEAVLDRFIEHYSTHLVVHTVLYPGVSDTLTKLDGYKMAVVTNKRKALSERALTELGVAHHFTDILGSDSVGAKKPSPLPILHLLEKYSIPPEKAVIVGDSEIDVQAGKAAGIKTVALTSGYRNPGMLQEAHFILDNIRELPEIVGKL